MNLKIPITEMVKKDDVKMRAKPKSHDSKRSEKHCTRKEFCTSGALNYPKSSGRYAPSTHQKQFYASYASGYLLCTSAIEKMPVRNVLRWAEASLPLSSTWTQRVLNWGESPQRGKAAANQWASEVTFYNPNPSQETPKYLSHVHDVSVQKKKDNLFSVKSRSEVISQQLAS